jgi:prepilin-type N-terminal cleavage/methylation domain-containing protein
MWRFNNRGFSLMEVLIVTLIASVVGVLLVSFVFQSNGLFYQQSSKVSQGIATNDVIDEVRETALNSSAIASSYPVVSPQYTSGTSTLILELPSVDNAGNMIGNTHDYVVFTKDSQSPKIFRKLVFPNAQSARKSENMVLSTRLSLLNFYYLDETDKVVSPTLATQINLVINQSEKAGSFNQQSSASATVNLRNN